MRECKMKLPKCAPPSVKLLGRGGKGGDELAITTEVPFLFALDDLVLMPQCLFNQIVTSGVCWE